LLPLRDEEQEFLALWKPTVKLEEAYRQLEFTTKHNFLHCCSLLSSRLDDVLPCDTIENDGRKIPACCHDNITKQVSDFTLSVN